MSLLALKPRTLIGIALFILLAAIALSDSRDARVMLLAPAAALFTFHTALYGLEYDNWVKGSSRKSA